MRGPLVSIVMTAFESDRTLGAAILGVINQSYQDWELILVDDGSSVDLQPEVRQFADRRILYTRLETNQGIASALNAGLALAGGRYVARMDSDDYMEDWRIAEQLRFLMLKGLTFCGTDARKFGEESEAIRNPRSGRQVMDSFLTGNPFVHPTVMFDRERIRPKLAYDAALRCEEDYELWARLVTPENCANMEGEALRFRVTAGSNANHPAKHRCNMLALAKFAQTQGLGDALPIRPLSEFQMTRFVDEPAFLQLRDYAAKALQEGWPKVGMLQGPLLEYRAYSDFVAWLMRAIAPQRCGGEAVASPVS